MSWMDKLNLVGEGVRLALPQEDFEVLKTFLQQIGVRTRVVSVRDGIASIQADNPYMDFIGGEGKKHADKEMSLFSIGIWQEVK